MEKVDKLLEALVEKDDLRQLVRCLERSQKDVSIHKSERDDHPHNKRWRGD